MLGSQPIMLNVKPEVSPKWTVSDHAVVAGARLRGPGCLVARTAGSTNFPEATRQAADAADATHRGDIATGQQRPRLCGRGVRDHRQQRAEYGYREAGDDRAGEQE